MANTPKQGSIIYQRINKIRYFKCPLVILEGKYLMEFVMDSHLEKKMKK